MNNISDKIKAEKSMGFDSSQKNYITSSHIESILLWGIYIGGEVID